jgi:diacylglycerol kinase family enzyme
MNDTGSNGKKENIIAKLQGFGSVLAEMLSRSQVVPEQALRWTIIVNPKAGGFTIGRRWKKHAADLVAGLEKVQCNPVRPDAVPSSYAAVPAYGGEAVGKYGLILTAGPGHAMAIAKGLLETVQRESAFHLIITAGGDGTSLEVLQALYHAPSKVRSSCAIFRLPLGTGNDGAEAWELEDALEFLIKPVRIELSRGLKLSTATGKTWQGGLPFLAFNILSVGLDAFVTHMTNRMKGKLPGDSYKLWVDIAALFYDRIYKVGPMHITGYDESGREVQTFREKLLLCAMGVSGRRCYGSRQMILPDDRNVCAIKQMSLYRKIVLKDLIVTGGHAINLESILFNASRIVLSGEYPILAQMDGETVLLEKADFPAVIELTDPVIPVLKIM